MGILICVIEEEDILTAKALVKPANRMQAIKREDKLQCHPDPFILVANPFGGLILSK
jgi:hypothetical protein